MVVKQVRVSRSELPSFVRIGISSVTVNDIAETITYVFKKPHRMLVGYSIDIVATSPSEFNQSNAKVITVNSANSFTINKTVSAGSSYISGGYIEVPISPETDKYLVRYRITNSKNETSQWSPLFEIDNSYDEDTPFNYLDGGES